jgi:transcriptional regulator with XRE-family HTH domain
MRRASQNDSAKILGRNIRQARLAKHWTQEILAFHCNLDRSYIGSLERGKRNPNFQTLRRVAKALEVSVISLMIGL